MNQTTNKYIKASYSLYDITDGKHELLEQTEEGRPFDFMSGMGICLQAFEDQVTPLNKGDKFSFDLAPDQAYGQHVAERVLELDKQIFQVNGKFDDAHIKKDAIVPLQNADGQRFNAVVLEIGDDKVKLDLNHPLAGKTLHFDGEVLDSYEASKEDVAEYVNKLNAGHSCGGNCGSCGEGGCGNCNGSCKC